MANNYTQSSSFIQVDEKRAKKLISMLDEAAEQDDRPSLCEATLRDDGVWISDNGESINIDGVISTLAKWVKEVGYESSIEISWSNTCSKPRIGEFDGGSAFISPSGSVVWSHSAYMDAVKALIEKEKKS